MLILLNLIEEGSHCVYLGYIVAVSLPLRNLDWILTFSSFRFRFPCAVFKVHARLPQPFGLSQLRGCGTVVSSPLVEPLGSPSVGIHLRRPFASSTELEGSSFLPILQNDTVFQSRFQSVSFAALRCCGLSHSLFSASQQLSSSLISSVSMFDLGFGSLFTNHFSLERR